MTLLGTITESEATTRGLTPDHVTLDEDGRHVLTSHAAGVQWDLTAELPDRPPLPPFYGVVS